MNDLHDLEDVSPYKIILCDILDTGRTLGGKSQGAFLIAQIKRRFPDKYVIAYTAAASGDLAVLAAQHADNFMLKDADTEDWVLNLDEAIKQFLSPIEIWKRARRKLTDANIAPEQIAILEEEYVNKILNKHERPFDHVIDVASNLQLGPDVRGILQSLAASAMYNFVT